MPHAGMTKEPHPRLFARERLSADEPGDDRVGPEGGVRVEIVQAVAAQDETLGLDDGNVDRHGVR